MGCGVNRGCTGEDVSTVFFWKRLYREKEEMKVYFNRKYPTRDALFDVLHLLIMLFLEYCECI